MYSYDGSCRLIELSSFQFDTEISGKRPDEKSWWLNIEKHAKALLSLWQSIRFWRRRSCRFVRAFVCRDLCRSLNLDAAVTVRWCCVRSGQVPKKWRTWRTWWKIDTLQRDCGVIYFRLSESTIVVGRLFSTSPTYRLPFLSSSPTRLSNYTNKWRSTLDEIIARAIISIDARFLLEWKMTNN